MKISGGVVLAAIAWASFFVLSWLVILGRVDASWSTTIFTAVFGLIGFFASMTEAGGTNDQRDRDSKAIQD